MPVLGSTRLAPSCVKTCLLKMSVCSSVMTVIRSFIKHTPKAELRSKRHHEANHGNPSRAQGCPRFVRICLIFNSVSFVAAAARASAISSLSCSASRLRLSSAAASRAAFDSCASLWPGICCGLDLAVAHLCIVVCGTHCRFEICANQRFPHALSDCSALEGDRPPDDGT